MRADDHVGQPVAVYVAGARDTKAREILDISPVDPKATCSKGTEVDRVATYLAKHHIALTSRAFAAWISENRANDYVRKAIAVYVARTGNTAPGTVLCIDSVDPETAAAKGGKNDWVIACLAENHVALAGPIVTAGTRTIGANNEVGQAITVDIPCT
jgi:hypothetical protein